MPVVSISGPSGSGKSSLVRALIQRLPQAIALYFDDYKETTHFPSDLAEWVRTGCNPNQVSTPKMVEDLIAAKRNPVHQWLVVEEPFGKARNTMAELIDYSICIDIPPEIAFARTIKRAALTVPKEIKAAELVTHLIAFVDEYLVVGRETYSTVNEYVMKTCNQVVDGTRDTDQLADEIADVLLGQSCN